MTPTRNLTPEMLADLQEGGRIHWVVDLVLGCPELDFQIRNKSFNVYYRGNSLMEVHEDNKGRYISRVHRKYLPLDKWSTEGSQLTDHGFHAPDAVTFGDSQDYWLVILDDHPDTYLTGIGDMMAQADALGRYGNELEFEQLLIRANNWESRNATDLLVVDRQYARTVDGRSLRMDLVGIEWPRKTSSLKSPVRLVVLEVKYGLNNDIQELAQREDGSPGQLVDYHTLVCGYGDILRADMEAIIEQKRQLGLLCAARFIKGLPDPGILRIDDAASTVCYVVALIDFNPFSKLVGLGSLGDLPFAKQVRLMHCGFGMWNLRLDAVEDVV